MRASALIVVAAASVLHSAGCGGGAPGDPTDDAGPGDGGGRAPDAGTEPDASVFVAVDGDDGGDCGRAAPCRTFDRAYHVAAPGEVVDVAAGRYPRQQVTADASKQGDVAEVLFRPADGGEVELVGDLVVGASNARFRDLRIPKLIVAGGAAASADHLVFERIDGEAFLIAGPAAGVTIRGGDWGPSLACHARGTTGNGITSEHWCPEGSPYAETGNTQRYNNKISSNPEGPARDVVIDGARFHDVQTLDGANLHIECLFIVSGEDIAVRRSSFRDCSVMDVFVQDYSGHGLRGVTLENNWFAAPRDQDGNGNGMALSFGQSDVTWRDVVIAHNSFGTFWGFDGANVSYEDVRVVGNVGRMRQYQCIDAPGLSYAHNLWFEDPANANPPAACDATDVAIAAVEAPYVSPTHDATFDYHLAPGSAAEDLVPRGATGIVEDFDGDARPCGAGAEAGADERCP